MIQKFIKIKIVWKNTKRLGLGLGIGTLKKFNSYYCVAQYQPAGNYDGQFMDNVFPPRNNPQVCVQKFY